MAPVVAALCGVLDHDKAVSQAVVVKVLGARLTLSFGLWEIRCSVDAEKATQWATSIRRASARCGQNRVCRRERVRCTQFLISGRCDDA